MTKEQQVKNIIAFLSILFGENHLWYDEIMKFTPEYLIEKFERYIHTTKYGADWGLHQSLRRNVFERYCDKWKVPYQDYEVVE